jgi:hypothetical protein
MNFIGKLIAPKVLKRKFQSTELKDFLMSTFRAHLGARFFLKYHFTTSCARVTSSPILFPSANAL